ncbi:DUF4439 domain-containing protein [Actinotalea sp. K2]|uniref:DUF4439 domain-containing protein n=1 Tax=Actinotalea sp. K2 TaxID=2939438 RepID=UPI002017B8DE|nr:DUF4439 domain-containing protein [Actinotalea sp. K2]MCL3860206.1 ferritin-like domain-containing protein [Actinotalea sp. K2]
MNVSSAPDPPDRDEPRPGRRARRRLGTLLVVVSLAASGCGLRLETGPPDPLPAGEVELARQSGAATADDLSAAARTAAQEAPEQLRAVLLEVADAADQHLVALGGRYDPGPGYTIAPDGSVEAVPEAPDDAAAPTPTSAAPPVTSDDVVARLVQGAASARSHAVTVPDGALARLLASIHVARLLQAQALAAASGAEPLEEVVVTVPQVVPEGLSPATIATLVQSEDATGMAWEVAAARAQGETRDRAAARAAQHRQRAQAWSDAAGFTGTGLDPRRSAYELPEAIRSAAAEPGTAEGALADLEQSLSAVYATLVLEVVAEDRGPLVDVMADTAREAVRHGATVPVFPGLAEQQS